ncbi:MAG: hypothetical protein NZM11_00230 [Anaerolineales bacterium]|nr:hypothetical protein [Anaerolineales bacterium]
MTSQPSHHPRRNLGLMFLFGGVSGLLAAFIATVLGQLTFALAVGLGDQAGDWILAGIVFVTALLPGLLVSGGVAGLAGGLASGLLVLPLWRPSCRWLAAWLIVWALGGLSIQAFQILTMTNANPELNLLSLGGWSVLGGLLALGFALVAPPWAQRR